MNKPKQTLKIYGGKQSRAIRNMWLMEEMELDYTSQPLDFATGENKTDAYLALNPSGKVPTLIDGDFSMTESLAINLYLAEKYDSALYPNTSEDLAKVNQWTLWALTEVETFLTLAFREMRLADDADQEKIADHKAAALEAVATIETEFSKGNDYLLGAEFSMADLNTACVLCFLPMIGATFDDYPLTSTWLGRCLARPAWQKLQS